DCIIGQKWVEAGDCHRPETIILHEGTYFLLRFVSQETPHKLCSHISSDKIPDRCRSQHGSKTDHRAPYRPVGEYGYDHDQCRRNHQQKHLDDHREHQGDRTKPAEAFYPGLDARLVVTGEYAPSFLEEMID